jgi:hypothetical protein
MGSPGSSPKIDARTAAIAPLLVECPRRELGVLRRRQEWLPAGVHIGVVTLIEVAVLDGLPINCHNRMDFSVGTATTSSASGFSPTRVGSAPPW